MGLSGPLVIVIIKSPLLDGYLPLAGHFINGMNHQIVKVVTSIFHFLCAFCKGAKGVHPGLRAAQVPGGWSDAIAHLPGLIMIIIRYTGISVAMGWDEDIFSRRWLIVRKPPT